MKTEQATYLGQPVIYIDGERYYVDNKTSNAILMHDESIYANNHLRANWETLLSVALPDGEGTVSILKAPRGIYAEKRDADGNFIRFTLLKEAS